MRRCTGGYEGLTGWLVIVEYGSLNHKPAECDVKAITLEPKYDGDMVKELPTHQLFACRSIKPPPVADASYGLDIGVQLDAASSQALGTVRDFRHCPSARNAPN